MSSEILMSFETLKGIYRARLSSAAPATASEFPRAPTAAMPAAEFVSHLLAIAAERDRRADHPFLRKLAAGGYDAARLREWVRQEYRGVLNGIRRHAVLASCADDCDLLRSLLAYVGAEADADPVGGAYFSLPQLWIKFGIALGLSRDEIVHAQPAPPLRHWQADALAVARRQSEVPVALIVGTLLNPALAAVLGERLQAQLGHPRESFDYFWAIAGNRWGEDAGRAILESWSADGAAQRQLWTRYAAERAADRECERLGNLQQAVESATD